MNPWYLIGMYGVIIVVLSILGISNLVILFRNRRKGKPIRTPRRILGLTITAAILVGLFIGSHQTYYRYNDWWIKKNGMLAVEQRYGDFDLGNVKEGEGGRVGYYIYTDDGPIMPDHLKHYYYIEYDGQGNVTSVYEESAPGA